MTDSIDELGSVEYVVIEFPEGQQNFTGEIAAAIADLVEKGLIRVLDLMIVAKDADGNVDAFEIDDFDPVDEIVHLEADIAEILAAEDVAHLAEAMAPGSVAGVLVWENLWSVPFAVAARKAGGQLVANGRIPLQAIAASLEAEANA